MTWFPFALLAALILSLIAITDKLVVERFFRDGWSFPFFVSLFLGGYSAILLVVRGSLGLFGLPAFPMLVIALAPGIFQYLGSVFYSRALLRTDAATVAVMGQIVPIYALIWGWIFFGNVYSVATYAGVITIMLCCTQLGMVQRPGVHRLRLDSAVWLMLTCTLLRSLADLAVKMTLDRQDAWNTLGLSHVAQFPIALLMLGTTRYRRILSHSLGANGARVVFFMTVYEAFVIVVLVLNVTAYARGPLGLVTAVVYSKPFFVLLLTALVNRLHPGLIPEPPNRQSLARRAALILGVLAGVIMLQF